MWREIVAQITVVRGLRFSTMNRDTLALITLNAIPPPVATEVLLVLHVNRCLLSCARCAQPPRCTTRQQ